MVMVETPEGSEEIEADRDLIQTIDLSLMIAVVVEE
jgi:hypothetical protein